LHKPGADAAPAVTWQYIHFIEVRYVIHDFRSRKAHDVAVAAQRDPDTPVFLRGAQDITMRNAVPQVLRQIGLRKDGRCRPFDCRNSRKMPPLGQLNAHRIRG
jgi:hypothetical protein